MSIDIVSDLSAFNQFVGSRLSDCDADFSLEDGLAAFRAYQEELARFREEIQPSIDELDAGGGVPLDMDAILAKGRKELAGDASRSDE